MISNWDQLINKSYRSLLFSGRNYASYSKKQIDYFVSRSKKADTDLVFDPMSGYGTLTAACNQNNIATFNVEINPPAYLWQYLCLPDNYNDFRVILHNIKQIIHTFPLPNIISEVSGEWISSYGLSLLSDMFSSILSRIRGLSLSVDSEKASLAILLPFVSRISTITNGDIHHVKKGGIAIYKNYIDDFCLYIDLLLVTIFNVPLKGNNIASTKNVLLFDDCQSSSFLNAKFSFMVTSPPYPNLIDYAKMFGAENYFLDHLRKQNIILLPSLSEPIGTNIVEGKGAGEISSKSANVFIAKIYNYHKTSKMKKDNEGYYAPYFSNYFFNMEKAYQNIATHASDNFEGIVVVRNNAARIYTVPVAESICEIWKLLGFDTEYLQEDEVFHVGTKNPNSKGFKAKQTEYVIRIWR